MISGSNDPHKAMKSKLVSKVMPHIRKNGFQSTRMDDFAKNMDVSKATMYKYFCSKEEIIGSAADELIDYIKGLEVETEDESIDSMIKTMAELFEQSIIIAAYISDRFLYELELVYPDIYGRLTDVMGQREKHIKQFYQKGKELKVFNDLNEDLILLQSNIMIRAMLDIKFLMSNHLTLSQVLEDYYNLIKHQLFSSEQLSNVDDNLFKAKLEYISMKITRDLF